MQGHYHLWCTDTGGVESSTGMLMFAIAKAIGPIIA